MRITYIAQSGFIIEHANWRVGIDLWLQNPLNPKQLTDIPKLDVVLVTHDHFDHDLKSAIALAKRDQAPLVSGTAMAEHAQQQGVTTVVKGEVGQSYAVGPVQVTLTRADHSSDIGIPVGFIINWDGRVIYHMGDTDYFPEVKKYQASQIETLFVPIGGTFTMGPSEAAKAVADLQPKRVIPMHYNTFDQIKQDPEQFKQLVQTATPTMQVDILAPGETVTL